MAYSFVHYMWTAVFLGICVDQGDGRWKWKDRDKLEQDMVDFRNMARKIEHEIEDFYDDYPDAERVKEEDDTKFYSTKSYVNHYDITTKSEDLSQLKPYPQNITREKHKELQNGFGKKTLKSKLGYSAVSFIPDIASKKYLTENLKWPKFEDMLLNIGKKYDWKNDRWIKVKQRLLKTPSVTQYDIDRKSFLSKHNFSYRTVKLSRIKSRRNVVIAVKAVR